MQNTVGNSGSGILAASSSFNYPLGTSLSGTSVTQGLSAVGPTITNLVLNPGYQSGNPVSSFSIKNTQNMQVKLAVFKVKRDEKGSVTSSEFVKEFWVEKLPNVSIELLAVKELEPGFDPNDIVIKEILTVYL